MSGKEKRDVAEAAGRWLTDIDPSKISREELRRILNIPDANEMLSYVIVKVPPGTRMRMGVAGKSADGVRGGATQFDLIDNKVDGNWILKTHYYGE